MKIVLTTIDSEKKAEVLTKQILEKNLAACIQIQKIKSFYKWKDVIENADEYLLVIKTKTELFSAVSEFIKSNHSYEIPEIIEIPITNGSKEYLEWLACSTSCISPS